MLKRHIQLKLRCLVFVCILIITYYAYHTNLSPGNCEFTAYFVIFTVICQIVKFKLSKALLSFESAEREDQGSWQACSSHVPQLIRQYSTQMTIIAILPTATNPIWMPIHLTPLLACPCMCALWACGYVDTWI